MKLIKLEWRNIFSYGNKLNTLDFGNNGKLWQLSGISGAGKSSLLNIPKLLFYGKTEGTDGKPISVNEIANWTNGNGYIKGIVQNGTNIFTIERTFSPHSLTIYKNDVQVDIAGTKFMQEYIQSEILDNLPYNIFSTMMTLSLNSGKTFISMSPGDKRDTVDKIFALEIINKIHEYVKSDKKELGNNINLINAQIFSLEQTIKSSTAKLEELHNKKDVDYIAAIESLKERIERVKALDTEQTAALQDCNTKIEEINKKATVLTGLITEKNHILADINRQLNLITQDKCPTCGTPFTGERFIEMREELQMKRESVVEEINALQPAYDELQSVKTANSQLQTQIWGNISAISKKYNELVIELKSIENAANNTDAHEAIQQLINETSENKSVMEGKVAKANEKMELLSTMETLYASDGIKKIMMGKFIPMLNKDIDDTLKELGFPYELSFDDNFDACIHKLGREVKSQNLSLGEHKKMDLTVLCALLRFLKRRYPQLNLVCLDETVSSLDYESSSNMISHLKTIAKEMNLHIFIVSHTQLDESLFDEHIQITKNLGFSEIEFV